LRVEKDLIYNLISTGSKKEKGHIKTSCCDDGSCGQHHHHSAAVNPSIVKAPPQKACSGGGDIKVDICSREREREANKASSRGGSRKNQEMLKKSIRGRVCTESLELL
jgi:hypothetical protein